MRRCTGCGLLFNSPRLDDAALAKLYGSNYYFFMRRDARELPRIVHMYQRTIALVAGDVHIKRSMDIGCGRGYLPAVLRGLDWDVRGVEISIDAAEYAEQRFGLEVFCGTIEQYVQSSQRETFPLVTAIDVLEHVPAPGSFIAAAAQIVEPGGWLIIDTPNGAARNIEVKSVAWKGFNPFHVYLFNTTNLSSLLTQHGSEVTHAFSYGNEPAEHEPLRLKLAPWGGAAIKALRSAPTGHQRLFQVQGIRPGGRRNARCAGQDGGADPLGANGSADARLPSTPRNGRRGQHRRYRQEDELNRLSYFFRRG